jgi:hypothetical protein
MGLSQSGNGDGTILTPDQFGDAFALRPDRPLFVCEMPDCRFNKLPVCLASNFEINVPIMLSMQSNFRKVWQAIHEAFESGKVQRP